MAAARYSGFGHRPRLGGQADTAPWAPASRMSCRDRIAPPLDGTRLETEWPIIEVRAAPLATDPHR